MLKRVLALLLLLPAVSAYAHPVVETSAHPTPRESFAAQELRAVVRLLPGHVHILLAQRQDALLLRFGRQVPQFWPGAKEAFVLRRIGNTIVVAGVDASGVLYGEEELADRVRAAGALPAKLDFEDHPQLPIRGAVIGLQKPQITYEGAEYDYRYTPANFPWFYDKAEWTRYLDQLAEQRTNALFLWNGHPFTSLLRLPKYPEAQELPTAQLEQNIAMYHWLTAEADKRGIWILQGFYNIHLSHAFARAHHLPYHLSTPNPLATEYTRYVISEFLREYPHVGLFVTLGEALGPHYGAEWLKDAILPGVRDGLAKQAAAVGHPVEEPPIVIRAHATDIADVLKTGLPLYSNIDTMFKWNGESLTWTNVRGPVRKEFEMLVAESHIAIANIHLLSDLEPFRWGDPEFVQQITRNFVRIGIGGAHVYPLRYWDWPYTADATEPRLLQTDRDWIWFASWARYEWNPERDPVTEHQYWSDQFAERFASPIAVNAQGYSPMISGLADGAAAAGRPVTLTPKEEQTGEHLLNAYQLAGVCAPQLLPWVGITEGNRQVLSLGMTMPQLIDAKRFGPAQTLWTGDAPDGERLDEWVSNEVHHLPHHGTNPLAAAASSAADAAKAVAETQAAAAGIAASAQPEYRRVVNDFQSLSALMNFYNAKTQAAAQVLEYGYDRNLEHLQKARTLLATSVDAFAQLTTLTKTTYIDAAGMETSQRRIPVTGGPQTNHWRDLLPVYRRELAIFDQRLKLLENGGSAASTTASEQPLPQVSFTLAPGAGETFTVAEGASLLAGKGLAATALSPRLAGLRGIRIPAHGEHPIHFTLSKPAQVLVGFLTPKGANMSADTEQWNLFLPDGITAHKEPVSVWAKPLAAGDNELDLGDGTYVVLGFVPEDTHVAPGVQWGHQGREQPDLDWLFEN